MNVTAGVAAPSQRASSRVGALPGGGGPASLSGVAQQDGGFGACFRGVKDGAEILEVAGDLAERRAVPGGQGAGVGGAGGH